MVYLAAYGALRFGELIGLRRSDLDLGNGEVIIASQLVEINGTQVRTEPKSVAGIRRVTLPPFVLTELRAHLDRYVPDRPDAALFTGGAEGHRAAPTGQRHGRRLAQPRTFPPTSTFTTCVTPVPPLPPRPVPPPKSSWPASAMAAPGPP
jgi:integrase